MMGKTHNEQYQIATLSALLLFCATQMASLALAPGTPWFTYLKRCFRVARRFRMTSVPQRTGEEAMALFCCTGERSTTKHLSPTRKEVKQAPQ